jgi:uncharacterized protein (DUF1697 family)
VSNGYVALIRAINVGSSNRIAMARLAELFIEAGCTDVSWYLQTGNVLFDHPRREPDALAAKLEAMLVEAGLKNAAVIIRTSRQLTDFIAANPFDGVNPDTHKRSVSFLRSSPTDTPLDRIHKGGAEATYMDDTVVCLTMPNAAALSGGASTVIDKYWGTASTTRWWHVVEAIQGRC